MDTEYLAKLLLSGLIFAPGLFLLAIAMVVGLLMMLEKTGMLASMARKKGAARSADQLIGTEVNPPAGDIVADLQETLEPAAAEKPKRKQA
jgi:hypothetical protein